MKKLKDFAFKKPVLFSIFIIVIAVSFTEIPLDKYVTIFSNNQYDSYLKGIFEQISASIILVILLIKLGIFEDIGFTNIKNWKNLWIGWPFVIYSILNIWSIFDGTLTIDTSKPMLIILYTITYLSTGLFEEILCRGVVLSVMLHKWGDSKKGIYLSVIASSTLFGIFHMINFALGRSTLIATFAQITYGFFIGIFFAACFLRNKSIWPVIILHAVVDVCGGFQEIAIGFGGGVYTMTLVDALISILLMLPLLIYGFYILRKVTPTDIENA